MVASALKVAANRKNARKSTGPKTPEGKAKSRANAIKHGLTGAGVALPTEDAAIVERRFLGLQEEMGPTDLAGRLLVRQMALMSVRIDRAAKQERAALARKIRHASTEFELHRLKEIDRLFESIEDCPGDHRRRLLTQPEGVDKLVDALASVRDQLKGGLYRRWEPDHLRKIEAFFGGTSGGFPMTRTEALLSALDGDITYLKSGEATHLTDKYAKARYASGALIRIIEDELTKLAAIRSGLDPEVLAQDRLEAADRALFDPDPDATAARKYEAAAIRNYFRAFRDFRENEANPVEPSPKPLDVLEVGPALDADAADNLDAPDVSSIQPLGENVEDSTNRGFEDKPNVQLDEINVVAANTESDLATPFRQNEPKPAALRKPPFFQNEPNVSRHAFHEQPAQPEADGSRIAHCHV